LLQLTAEEFFRLMLVERLACRAVVEGVNFRFGHNREGSIETLVALCQPAGIRLAVVPPLLHDGVPVSSSRVRDALLRAAAREAPGLFGRPCRLRGVVGRGQQGGQTLGFPTANLVEVASLVPAEGVYAVRAYGHGRAWPAAANIGPNPTFGEKA